MRGAKYNRSAKSLANVFSATVKRSPRRAFGHVVRARDSKTASGSPMPKISIYSHVCMCEVCIQKQNAEEGF